jgi:hypothetical protein
LSFIRNQPKKISNGSPAISLQRRTTLNSKVNTLNQISFLLSYVKIFNLILRNAVAYFVVNFLIQISSLVPKDVKSSSFCIAVSVLNKNSGKCLWSNNLIGNYRLFQ